MLNKYKPVFNITNASDNTRIQRTNATFNIRKSNKTNKAVTIDNNGVAYKNGNRLPVGYTVYDTKKKIHYIVNKSGKLVPNVKKSTILPTVHKPNSPLIQYRPIPRRQRDNTSPTSNKSQLYEDHMALRTYAYLPGRNYMQNFGKAYGDQYDYDVPFLPEKSINILGHTTSTNLLDSIAKYAGIHNRSVVSGQYKNRKGRSRSINKNEMLGLTTQETHNGSQIMFNQNKDNSRDLANANYFTAFGSAPAESFGRDFQYSLDQTMPPLQHMFWYYGTGKYNTGDPNHTKDVNAVGSQVWKIPQVQNWWNTSGKKFYNGEY